MKTFEVRIESYVEAESEVEAYAKVKASLQTEPFGSSRLQVKELKKELLHPREQGNVVPD